MRRRVSRLQRREWLTAYVFVLPQVLGLLVFITGPLLLSIYYTFTRWDLIAPSPTWVGLANWQYLLQDGRITTVLWNTIRFILTGTTSFLILSLLVALLLNRRGKGMPLYRALFVLPWVMSAVAVGTTWRWLLNTQSGPVEQVFSWFGQQSPDWLSEAQWAMIAIAAATTWQALGYGMTIMLAGLQNIPEYLYDAAKVDGANAWQRFRYVTFPQLSPVSFFLLVTSLIAAFQLYDAVITMTAGDMTAAGGPYGSTTTVVLYMVNQMFNYSERLSGIGYASTLAWMLAFIVILVTLVQWVVARRWVFYGGDE
jgi:multiple sugar transport system permease protein